MSARGDAWERYRRREFIETPTLEDAFSAGYATADSTAEAHPLRTGTVPLGPLGVERARAIQRRLVASGVMVWPAEGQGATS